MKPPATLEENPGFEVVISKKAGKELTQQQKTLRRGQQTSKII